MRSRLPWVLFGLTCLLAAAHMAVLAVDDQPLLTTHAIASGFPLVTLGAVTGAGIGALILSRYPRHRIGWLFLIGQLLTEFDVTAQAYGEAALNGQLGAAPAGHLAMWLSVMFGAILTLSYLAVLFLLAPTGHLLSPRWRWAAATTATGLLLHTAAVASISPSRFAADSQVPGGVGPAVVAMTTSGVLLVCAGLVAAVVSLILRLRRSSGPNRQQLWWTTLAAGALTLGAVVSVSLSLLGVPDWVAVLPVMSGYVCVPIFTGVAVLRHRLYDIDVFINRAIVLGMLTAFVTGGYVAVVVLIGRLVNPAPGSFWPSLLATALIALAFQPLRARLGRFADRVVYGARAVPYEALADFSRRLQESPGAHDFLPRVAETIGRAVGAQHVGIWVDRPGGPRAWVGWPDDSDNPPDLVVPVTSEGDDLGGICVAMPIARPLREAERRLLADFARQLVHALRIARLQAALAERIEELDRTTTELAQSSRRLTQAQDAERDRFKDAIRHAVLPHLQPLPASLDRLETDVAAGRLDTEKAAEQIEELIRASVEALESLRALTRGVFPAQLAHRGLVSALSSHLADAGLIDVLDTDDATATQRLDPRVESAAYFCAVEFLRELDRPRTVAVGQTAAALTLQVLGDTATAIDRETRHLLDRAAALGGTARISGGPDVASLYAEFPTGSSVDVLPDLQETVAVEG